MARPPRNPRRAYDEQGKEIAPPTVGDHKRQGLMTVVASCDACMRDAVVNLAPFPDNLPVSDVALKLKCSSCGSKRVTVSLNMAEYYELLRQKTGWSPLG